ncbi:hypothetical protein MGG_02779 [Pyricularia oryzae 70-15]|uniref:Pal1 cell morphology protein n=3 Tax=Pyricularia oryzae TaxID=318829 RepID=G5EH22_PYRO7|nr:uncharacterized protein MGG_02779 [Pyricularia oryzae 70-15]ELQ41087.1 hypothetical protein OOU_Y34scaffold00301g7 [Pyricularia oryzae Y34]KAI7913067.1 hypothetical protein M9X92_009681 [Pyricularia oryzae]EAQ71125.1 hypothetical protein MGCH7_ch7g532 [Pyricularia oryzae 70-15]EHA46219.1 hypothetical protein MGG_02779 [Pyricularia oryzae 70-15]KAI7925281.1 hypothetical protein M0657_004257 [Pyricularia oryzae]
MSSGMHPDHSGQRSAGLSLNLSSNNPFRNRAASPNNLPQSPASPFDDPPPRPVSRNPFLDPSNKPIQLQQPLLSPDSMASKSDRMSPTAEEIFDSLTLDDRNDKKPPPPPGSRPQMGRPGPPRGENVPPPGGRRPPPSHRPTRSQEEAMRARRLQGSGAGDSRNGESSSPHRRSERRLRRNSESSVISTDKEKHLTEEEKKARDLRRRERERRHRERGDRDSKSKPRPSNRKLDIIDQLDATSIYGTGLFHHDGPFDALNPHRNKKGSSRAPMQAFPKDSLNNSMGGSGPLNARPDHATFMGNADQEAFREYSQGEKQGSSSRLPPVFDPLSRGTILHGDESMGLGTSTFLEGTPAARTVIQRREAEQQQDTMESGLQRKKSLAQRIRGINRPRRDFEAGGRMTNPEGVYSSRRSPPIPGANSSASMSSSRAERNPFFADYDGAKNGEESISVRRRDGSAPRVKSPTSPDSLPLERRVTGGDDDQAARAGGGLLARVKSLKGGRRTRPSPPDQPSPSAIPAPGTAA